MNVNKVTVKTTEFELGDCVELKPLLGNSKTRYYIITWDSKQFCYINLETGLTRAPSGSLAGLLSSSPPVCLVDYIELKR